MSTIRLTEDQKEDLVSFISSLEWCINDIDIELDKKKEKVTNIKIYYTEEREEVKII